MRQCPSWEAYGHPDNEEIALQFPVLMLHVVTSCFILLWGVVSPSPYLQAGGPPPAGFPRLFILYIRSYLSNCMEQSPSWEADSRWDSQTPRLLWN
jgi:hypothetical protein